MSDLTVIHRRLLFVVGALFVVTLIGLILLWPSSSELPAAEEPTDEIVTAEIRVFEIIAGETDPLTGRPGEFARVTLRIDDGPDEGQPVTLEIFLDGYPDFQVGDRVNLARMQYEDGEVEYYLTDFQRLPVLTILLGVFIAAVLIISRWHGLRALIGLGASLLIVVSFVVPSILAGRNPPLVAWVGAMAVMIVTLYLTHGFNEMTTAAVVGTAASLTITIGIGLLFINQARITGFASDDAVFARFAIEGLDLRGLVLAGLIIAALGVLDDVTVSQASTVFALHDTDRRLTWAGLFARAMRVGRDHIASVVNTLFLAYAGASLALLVLFSTSGLPVAEIINSEVLAEEIVKTVVGSLGLIAAVPFTTALAALLAVRRPVDAPPLRHRPASHHHGPLPTSRRVRDGVPEERRTSETDAANSAPAAPQSVEPGQLEAEVAATVRSRAADSRTSHRGSSGGQSPSDRSAAGGGADFPSVEQPATLPGRAPGAPGPAGDTPDDADAESPPTGRGLGRGRRTSSDDDHDLLFGPGGSDTSVPPPTFRSWIDELGDDTLEAREERGRPATDHRDTEDGDDRK